MPGSLPCKLCPDENPTDVAANPEDACGGIPEAGAISPEDGYGGLPAFHNLFPLSMKPGPRNGDEGIDPEATPVGATKSRSGVDADARAAG